MKPEHMSVSFQSEMIPSAMPSEEAKKESGEVLENDPLAVQEAFDIILARIHAEASSPSERLDRLYIAKDEAFNSRNYALLSKLADEIEERETPEA
ncbi:MAG: hypothetical protein PHT88_00975 [Candidatus Moranbacteria bacterium]|nr:hypothetical protein [Candidatus Moranbacteria bacterium]